MELKKFNKVKYIVIIIVALLSNYSAYRIARYSGAQSPLTFKNNSDIDINNADINKFSQAIYSYKLIYDNDNTISWAKKNRSLNLQPVVTEFHQDSVFFRDISKDKDLNGKKYFTKKSIFMEISPNDTMLLNGFIEILPDSDTSVRRIAINRYYIVEKKTGLRKSKFDNIHK